MRKPITEERMRKTIYVGDLVKAFYEVKEEMARRGFVNPTMNFAGLMNMVDALPDASERPVGVYECFHCGSRSVTWDADFDFEDFGYEGEGVVNCCHCNNCGADIQYLVRTDLPEEENGQREEACDNDAGEGK